jgi:hypothetical protein
MTRLVRWLIATTDQFPLIVSQIARRAAFAANKINFKTFVQILKKFIFYTFISATATVFISANEI